MADSAGVDGKTGKPLTNWDHVQQSIKKILTTPKGTRVMRREFGSNVPSYVDTPMTDQLILAIRVEAATAIAEYEPRFAVRAARVQGASAEGRLTIEILGSYYPRGHLGDFSIGEDRSTRVVFQ